MSAVCVLTAPPTGWSPSLKRAEAGSPGPRWREAGAVTEVRGEQQVFQKVWLRPCVKAAPPDDRFLMRRRSLALEEGAV